MLHYKSNITNVLQHYLRWIEGFKMESIKSSSNKWTKISCQDYLHRIGNFCTTVLNIFISLFLATPNVGNECWTSYESLESTGEMKTMRRFCIRLLILWNLEFTSLLLPKGSCYRDDFRQLLLYLALRKCENICKILKFILAPEVCPLKPEILSISSDNLASSYRNSCQTFQPSVRWRRRDALRDSS